MKRQNNSTPRKRTDDAAPRLFTYWEGPRYPLLEITRLLIDIYSANGKNYRPTHLGPDNLAEWAGPPHPHFARIARYQYRSDYARIAATRRHGGIYLDLDVLLTREPHELYDPPGGKGCFFTDKMSCVFAVEPGAPVIETIHAEITRMMDRRLQEPVGGQRADNDIAQPVFTWARREHPRLFAGYHDLQERLYLPTWSFEALPEYILKPYPNYRAISSLDADIFFLHLFGGCYVPLRLYSAEEILLSDHPVAGLLNTALHRAEQAGYAMPANPPWARAGRAAERLRRMEKAPATHPQYDLVLAAEGGHVGAARRLIRRVSPADYYRARYAEAVFSAFWHNHMDVAACLLRAPGLDINRIIDYRGCSVWKMRSGGNLLHLATDTAKPMVIDYLLRHTAIDANQRNDFHLTPLMFAAKHGKTDIIERLLKHPRLDRHAKTPAGETAYDLATDPATREALQRAGAGPE